MKNDFSISLADRTKYVYGADDIAQCWDTILKTVPGFIPLMPTFGSNLYQYIDKPVNIVYGEMVNTIIKDLEFWEKRATISKVTRVINGSQVILYIYGVYTSTGESIISKVDLEQIFCDIETALRGIGYDIIGETLVVY